MANGQGIANEIVKEPEAAVTPSCGCVYCDVGASTFRDTDGVLCHRIPGGFLLECTRPEPHPLLSFTGGGDG